MTEAYSEDGRLWFPMPDLGARSQWIEKHPDTYGAWTRLWSRAARWEKSDQFRGRPIPLEIGQLVTTYLGFAELMGWSRNRVRGFLQQLVKCQELEIRPMSYDRETDTWKDSKSDSGLLLLTLVHHPFRKKAAQKGTAERTGKRTADGANGQEKDRERTGKKDTEKDSGKDRDLGPVSRGEAVKPDAEKDRELDSEKDTSPEAAEAEKRTRLKQQQQNPSVSSPVLSEDRGVRGEIERIGLTLLPGGRREGAGHTPPRPPDPRHPMLGHPHPHRARELLHEIGMGRGFAKQVSIAIPLGRVFDVVCAARSREKPGGWARRAFEEGFQVDPPPEAELAQLRVELDQERAASAKKAAGQGRLTRAEPRRPDESAEDYLLRMNKRVMDSRRPPPKAGEGDAGGKDEDGRRK